MPSHRRRPRGWRDAERGSGEGGIRTHGRDEPTPHFECGTFGHSVTSPAVGGAVMIDPSPSRVEEARLAEGGLLASGCWLTADGLWLLANG